MKREVWKVGGNGMYKQIHLSLCGNDREEDGVSILVLTITSLLKPNLDSSIIASLEGKKMLRVKTVDEL